MKLIGFQSLLVLLGMAVHASACMNSYEGPRLSSEALTRSESVERQIFANHDEDWPDRALRLRAELDRGGDFRVKNDLAVALAHAGNASQAVILFEEIERDQPGLYNTAANLGTAYELAGDNVKALTWIRRGIERNGNAHGGTEWLHVRILEVKLALEKNPRFLAERSILGFSIDEPPESVDIRGNRGEKLNVDRIKDALIYQLHERVQFVNRPDAVVGLLLYDLGRLIARESTGVGGAKDIFLQAKSYLSGLDGMDSFQRELNGLISSASTAQTKEHTPRLWKPLLIIAICLWGVVIAYFSRRLLARFAKRSCADAEL